MASPAPTLDFEHQFGYPGSLIAGVDEVGRGCLAGPVVTCAVILPVFTLNGPDSPPWIGLVRDSKLIPPKVREELYPKIQEFVLSHSIGEASVLEIDQINILNATHLAMKRAVEGLKVKPARVLVDGNKVPFEIERGLGIPTTAVIGGDRKSLTVACASILAKVYRDRMMADFEKTYPGYGLSVHKGYGTKKHLDALAAQGVTPIHRMSFAPVRAASTGVATR